jgi:hypothetical protein
LKVLMRNTSLSYILEPGGGHDTIMVWMKVPSRKPNRPILGCGVLAVKNQSPTL